MTFILEEWVVCRTNSVYKIGYRRFWDMKLPFRLASPILMPRLDSKLEIAPIRFLFTPKCAIRNGGMDYLPINIKARHL